MTDGKTPPISGNGKTPPVSGKEKKPRVRHEWEHDDIIKKIRGAGIPINRTKLKSVGLDYFLDDMIDEDTGETDYKRIARLVMEDKIESKLEKV